MKGHALAEQAGVEFLADVTLQALAEQVGTKVSAELKNSPYDLGDNDRQGDPYQSLPKLTALKDQIEGLAKQHRNRGRQGRVPEGAHQGGQHDPRVVGHVREDPARGAAMVARTRRTDEEFCDAHHRFARDAGQDTISPVLNPIARVRGKDLA